MPLRYYAGWHKCTRVAVLLVTAFILELRDKYTHACTSQLALSKLGASIALCVYDKPHCATWHTCDCFITDLLHYLWQYINSNWSCECATCVHY
jgi:hypothetical protein